MQTQYEVKFIQSVFALYVENCLQGLDMAQFIASKWNRGVDSECF
jgi:hypothetical protein